MRKLYQILYNVGRLTDAPGRRAFPFQGGHFGSGVSLSGGHFGVGKFARGKGARSYEARFSPSRSPFPGTSLFCAVVWGSVLANACMLLYWWHQAEPIFFRRTEGGLRSRPVPGGCCIAGANLLLPVVLLLALISAPACCIAGADLLLPVAVLTALTCSRLLSHH